MYIIQTECWCADETIPKSLRAESPARTTILTVESAPEESPDETQFTYGE